MATEITFRAFDRSPGKVGPDLVYRCLGVTDCHYPHVGGFHSTDPL